MNRARKIPGNGDSTLANVIPRLPSAKLRDNGITGVSVTQEAIKGNRLAADSAGKANLVSRIDVNLFR